MGQSPYGYRIDNGTAIIIEEEADRIRQIFHNYISGMSLADAAKSAGHPIVHGMVKRLLSRKAYLGDSFYPQIIDHDTFDKANKELKSRALKMNRLGKKRINTVTPKNEFRMNTPQLQYDDPYEQAEYIYSLIESRGKIA